jgi:hypothetical protein
VTCGFCALALWLFQVHLSNFLSVLDYQTGRDIVEIAINISKLERKEKVFVIATYDNTFLEKPYYG